MITEIIADALIQVGFDPEYVIFGTYKEVNQQLDSKPLNAVSVEFPAGIDILASVDLLFSGTTNFTQYGNAMDEMQFNILFARKNPGSIDVLQVERFNRAMGMMTYAKRFVLALNNDPRVRKPAGYIQTANFQAVYNLFDVDVDGVLLTVSIPVIAPVVAVC